jgi:cytidylate kinase
MIIAIDGPSGAGKSTLGKMLARELKLLYLDTGAMYRAIGLAVLESGSSIEDFEKAIEIARNSEITLAGEPEDLQIFINERDVSPLIRTPEVGQAASQVSTVSEVRRILVKRQQELGKMGTGCVLDGRDIGTVVFPNADVKFFLTAKPDARARRRFEEDKERGIAISFEGTLEEINQRDERDVSRADSPLSIAEDAIVIDTSELNLKEVFEEMLKIALERKTHLTKEQKSV